MDGSVSRGRIELILGPMFAGKTTELLRRVELEESQSRSCAVMKYAKDTRYAQDKVATHDLKMHPAIPCDTLMPMAGTCMNFEVVAVDEGQFFPDIVEFCEELASNGKRVVVAALDGDFRRKPLGKVLHLIARCDSMTRLTAVCRDTGEIASFTKRTIDSSEIEVIGGAESYRPVSRNAYFGIETGGEIHLTMGYGPNPGLVEVLKAHGSDGKKVVLIQEDDVPGLTVMKLTELPNPDVFDEFDVIGVEHGQKYAGIAEWADALANRGKVIEVSALEGDESNKPFANIVELFAKCERVQKLECAVPAGPPVSSAAFFCAVEVIPASLALGKAQEERTVPSCGMIR